MVLDARDKEIALGNHVRYVDTGTIGEVIDIKTKDVIDITISNGKIKAVVDKESGDIYE